VEATGDAQGDTRWQVRKCRGGPAPAQSFALVAH
jgi:cell division inhibitor SulA